MFILCVIVLALVSSEDTMYTVYAYNNAHLINLEPLTSFLRLESPRHDHHSRLTRLSRPRSVGRSRNITCSTRVQNPSQDDVRKRLPPVLRVRPLHVRAHRERRIEEKHAA